MGAKLSHWKDLDETLEVRFASGRISRKASRYNFVNFRSHLKLPIGIFRRD